MVGTPFPVSLAGRACEECKIELISGLLTLCFSSYPCSLPCVKSLREGPASLSSPGRPVFWGQNVPA